MLTTVLTSVIFRAHIAITVDLVHFSWIIQTYLLNKHNCSLKQVVTNIWNSRQVFFWSSCVNVPANIYEYLKNPKVTCDWLTNPKVTCDWLTNSKVTCDWLTNPKVTCDWLMNSKVTCDWLTNPKVTCDWLKQRVCQII